jgi:hypothetical protein
MPLPKTATKRQQSKARLLRWQARQAAIKAFGTKAVKGMAVHHKNGDNTDNHPKNLKLEPKSIHGKMHGRGNTHRNMYRRTKGNAKVLTEKLLHGF